MIFLKVLSAFRFSDYSNLPSILKSVKNLNIAQQKEKLRTSSHKSTRHYEESGWRG